MEIDKEKIERENREQNDALRGIVEDYERETDNKTVSGLGLDTYKQKDQKGREREYYLGLDAISIISKLGKVLSEDRKNCEVIIIDGEYGTGKTKVLEIFDKINYQYEDEGKNEVEKSKKNRSSKTEHQNIQIEKLEVFQSGYENNLLHYITTNFEEFFCETEKEHNRWKKTMPTILFSILIGILIWGVPTSVSAFSKVSHIVIITVVSVTVTIIMWQKYKINKSGRSEIIDRVINWVVILAAIPFAWDMLKYIFERVKVDSLPKTEIFNFFGIINTNISIRDLIWTLFFLITIVSTVIIIKNKMQKKKTDIMIYKKDYEEYFFESAIKNSVDRIKETKNADKIIIAFEDIDRIYQEENIIEILRIILRLKQEINKVEKINKKVVFVISLSLKNLRKRFKENRLVEPAIMKLSPKHILSLRPKGDEYKKMIKDKEIIMEVFETDEKYLDGFLNTFESQISWRMLWKIKEERHFYYSCIKSIWGENYIDFTEVKERIEFFSQKNDESSHTDFHASVKRFLSTWERESEKLYGNEILELDRLDGQMTAQGEDGGQQQYQIRIKQPSFDELISKIDLSNTERDKSRELLIFFKKFFMQVSIEQEESDVLFQYMELIFDNEKIKGFFEQLKNSIENENIKKNTSEESEENGDDFDISMRITDYLMKSFSEDEDVLVRSDVERLRKLLHQHLVKVQPSPTEVPSSLIPTSIIPMPKYSAILVGKNYAQSEGIDDNGEPIPKAQITTILSEDINKVAFEIQKQSLLEFYRKGE